MRQAGERSWSARGTGDGLAVNLQQCKYDIVRETAERLGYRVVAEGEEQWDLCWSDLSVTSDRVQKLRPFQRLNHFPGMLEICRKALLTRHMVRMAAKLPEHYTFYPASLLLPDQLDDLLAALRRNKAKIESGGTPATFILKPSAGTQGRGICLVQTTAQLSAVGDVSNSVAQAYIADPLLLDGYKFDLRVYALVSSVDPLRIQLFDEGLARLATQPYQRPSPANLRTAVMHLTNYAVNKGSAGFVGPDDCSASAAAAAAQPSSSTPPADGSGGAAGPVAGCSTSCSSSSSGAGSKRRMSAVLRQVAEQRQTSAQALMDSIAAVVVKSVLAVQPLLAHTYHTSLSAATASRAQHCNCPTLEHRHGNWSCSSHTASGGSGAGACSSSNSGCGSRRSSGSGCGEDAPPPPCSCPPSVCFELLGFDIMFDNSLQPWLLEVNHSPSFGTDSNLDRQVKAALLSQTMQSLGQRPEARQGFFEAQARAQCARLYNEQSAGGPASAADGGGGGGGVGATAPRPYSAAAMPRSRHLQATAAALEDLISSPPAAAAADRLYGGCSGSSTRPSTGRRLSALSCDTASVASDDVADVASARRLNSFTSCSSARSGSSSSISICGCSSCGSRGDGCDSCRGPAAAGAASVRTAKAAGSGGSGWGRFVQVYPAPAAADRHVYGKIMQAAADAYPDQRCQCPWCSRRRQARLMAMSALELGLSARPASALQSRLQGHLPCRPRPSSCRRGPRPPSTAAASTTSTAAAAGATPCGATGPAQLLSGGGGGLSYPRHPSGPYAAATAAAAAAGDDAAGRPAAIGAAGASPSARPPRPRSRLEVQYNSILAASRPASMPYGMGSTSPELELTAAGSVAAAEAAAHPALAGLHRPLSYPLATSSSPQRSRMGGHGADGEAAGTGRCSARSCGSSGDGRRGSSAVRRSASCGRLDAQAQAAAPEAGAATARAYDSSSTQAIASMSAGRGSARSEQAGGATPRGAPRVAMLAARRGRPAAVTGAEALAAAHELELMQMRMRAAALLSNRFVSVYVSGMGRGGAGRF